MKKLILTALLLLSTAAMAEEEGGHAEKKPPPKPPADSPLIQVLHLPVVAQWRQRVPRDGGKFTAWGEALKEIDGHKYWEVAVGFAYPDSITVWRRFCAPQAGGEVLVESIPADPMDEIQYKPYDTWVNECAPDADSRGKC